MFQEIDIGAASADHGEMVCHRPCTLQQALFTLTSELAGGTVTAPQVVFTKRITPLSATGEVVAATLIIPEATAIGKTVFLDVDVNFAIGDTLEISHVIGSGTPTGIGVVGAQCFDNYEDPRNNSDMVKSA